MMALLLDFGAFMVLAEGTGEMDDFPSRPIKVYVPYSAGGSSDLLPRSPNSVPSNYFDVAPVIVNKTGCAYLYFAGGPFNHTLCK